jgi:hypothetical protein
MSCFCLLFYVYFYMFVMCLVVFRLLVSYFAHGESTGEFPYLLRTSWHHVAAPPFPASCGSRGAGALGSLAMLVEQPKCLATAPSSHGMDGCKQLGSAQCSNEVLHHCPAIVIADVDYARAPSSHGMDRCMQLDEPQCADEVPHRCQAIAIEDVDCKARTARESAIFERWERDRLSWEDRLSRTENKACRDVAHRRSVVIMRAANLLKCW